MKKKIAKEQVVICPNKESVLTDKLPDGFVYEQFEPSYLGQFLSAAPTHPAFMTGIF